MEIKEFKVGTKVMLNGQPEAVGVITDLFGSRARVQYGKEGHTFGKVENLSDLTPIIPDTPRTRVKDLVPYWCKKATPADLAAVRSMVQDAIDACGLDATADVAVEKGEGCVTLGHNPIRAVIKLNGAYAAVRMRNGAVVKGMDTITVLFRREGGNFYREDGPNMFDVLSGNRRKMSREDALAAGDAIKWEGESVKFKASTNGHIRQYRCRHWYIYEGGVPGYGIEHLGGHYGYADKWENLKPDFAAYVKAVAHDLGYEGRVLRKEVA